MCIEKEGKINVPQKAASWKFLQQRCVERKGLKVNSVNPRLSQSARYWCNVYSKMWKKILLLSKSTLGTSVMNLGELNVFLYFSMAKNEELCDTPGINCNCNYSHCIAFFIQIFILLLKLRTPSNSSAAVLQTKIVLFAILTASWKKIWHCVS